MADMMTFPDTWEEFEEQYGFTDKKQIYTNGSRLIQSFRVKQWLDHLESEHKQADTPQTESTGSPIGDYRDGVGAWQTENIPTGCNKSWSAACTYCERYFSCDYLSGRHTDCGWGEPK